MIINIASTEKEARENGEFLSKIDANNNGEVFVYTYGTHHGLCVAEREVNGYSDSDFYMVVYVPEKDTFHDICFASTRGWSYPCMGSSVDASEELKEKYRKFLIRQERRTVIIRKRIRREKIHHLAKKANCKFSKVNKIFELYGEDKAKRMCGLLTKNIRSEFKKSLRNQLVTWMKGESVYQFPFTTKQLNYI